MSHVFSTTSPTVVFCEAPVLTVSFPRVCPCPGPGSVVLANGAVVDLNVLGDIVATFCPAFACPGLGAVETSTVVGSTQ